MSEILIPDEQSSWKKIDYYKVPDYLEDGYAGGWTVAIGESSVEIDVNSEYGLTFTHQEFVRFTTEILSHMTLKARNVRHAPNPQATYPKESHPTGGDA